MEQALIFKEPIPSCDINHLIYENGQWNFGYMLITPVELKPNEKYDLVIYEFISDLQLRQRKEIRIKESVNIPITSYDQYLEFLNKQREEDLRYRKEWLKTHHDAKPSTIILENKNYSRRELQDAGVHFISGILNQDKDKTEFIAI